MEGPLFVQQLRIEKKNRLETLSVLRMGVQGPLYQDNSNKMWKFQGTIILEINFIRIYVPNYIFLSPNILSTSLYIIAWKMRNLNKGNVLTSIEPISRNFKKSWENNLKNMGTICTQFRKSRKFFCSVIQGLKSLSSSLTQLVYLIVEVYLHYYLRHNYMFRLSNNSHLQVVQESLGNSYTRN